MFSLNRAQIIGNLTRDPELRNTATGRAVCNFGVATNFSYTDQAGQKQEQVEFHNIVAWGKLAEICSQYLTKGKKVYIEGRLQTREWDGQDGQKRRTTEIVTENMIMLGAPGAPSSAPRTASTPSAAPAIPVISYDDLGAGANTPGVTEEEIKVEDIPF